ncbi:inducible metalloproteinase inhibitor protein-like [Nymphalis io]|uniref:inducible metalloproteinase inhibitor protein-like n=1 Tax=Inachis io TaxID=171585 RepID=UPI002167CB94|nr:inducible metalloproteinase inhibitor protein-like [Nymphalis io]
MSCVIIHLVLIYLINFATAIDECGTNEVLKTKPDCASDYCPGAAAQCTDNQDPCSPCKCGLMYRRAANGTCISSRDCPSIPCGENETYDSCPVCSESCDNAVPSGKRCRQIGRIGITVICDPGCRCVDFYWRNNEKKCVTYEQCTQTQC